MRRNGLLAAILVLAAVAAPTVAQARVLYVANRAGNTISGLTIGSDGSLTGLPGSPFGTLPSPAAVSLTADGTRMVAGSHLNPGAAQGWSISGGGLLATSGSAVPTVGFPGFSSITPNGRFAFFSNGIGGTPTISRFSISPGGTLTHLAPDTPAGGINLGQLAVTPDGRYLYAVDNGGTSNVSGYAIGSDGSLTELASSPYNVGSTGGPSIVVSPDGRFVFIGDQSADIAVGRIAPDGSLTPAAPPVPLAGSALNTNGLALTADGRFLFTANFGQLSGPAVPSSISALSVSPSGTLAEVPGSPFPVDGRLGELAVTPDGSRLYAVYQGTADNIDGFAIAANGALTPLPGSPYPSGGSTVSFSLRQPIAVAPDQGPRAAFSARASHRTVTFDGSASTDRDGRVASWRWDFGDGQSATTAIPRATHTYASGNYVAALTVTDSEGCSARLLYTGQSALCNGSAAAIARTALDLAPPKISSLKVGKRKKRKSKVTFRLSEKASVTVKLERRGTGRKVGKKCAKPTRKNRGKRRCVRYTKVGSKKLKGKSGANKLTIGKRFGKRVTRGRYRLTLTATDSAGNKSKAYRKAFRIR